MKVANFLLPAAVIAAVVTAYWAGQYVGRLDAERHLAQTSPLQVASESADRLFIAGAVADFLKDARPTEALRVAEQYASVQADTVKACLAQPECSGWVASTGERRARLLALVGRYGGPASVD